MSYALNRVNNLLLGLMSIFDFQSMPYIFNSRFFQLRGLNMVEDIICYHIIGILLWGQVFPSFSSWHSSRRLKQS